MTHRSQEVQPNTRRLPDLPPDLFADDEVLYVDIPRRASSPRKAHSPERHSAPGPRPDRRRTESFTRAQPALRVASRETRLERPKAARRQTSELKLTMPVLPAPQAMFEQAVPNLLMMISIGAMLLLGSFTPMGIPVWAAGVFVPSVILALVATQPSRQPWRQAALINLATMAIVFPVLVVRQSVVRIPFVDGGNGTLLPPLIATVTIVFLLAALAVACAVLSQEDPEYAGIIFLPAAMMVPLLAGQSDLVSLSSGLLIALTIFGASAVLTIVATMLPPAYASILTPATIAIEFIVLTMFRSSSIFPIGSGTTAKLLFFIVVASTVALAILAPMMSVWVRQVTRLTRIQSQSPA